MEWPKYSDKKHEINDITPHRVHLEEGNVCKLHQEDAAESRNIIY